MVTYYEYNPNSITRVTEQVMIDRGKVFLRHIPKQGSIVIDGFYETDSLLPQPNQYSCQYALDSMYRDANRVLNFHSTHNNEEITVSYIAVGTVFTAKDANEIKAHMENQAIHSQSSYTLPTASTNTKGGVKIGSNLYMTEDTLNASAQPYDLPTMNATLKGGAKVGANLYMEGDTLNASIPAYNLPTASASVKGGVKIGANLYMTDDTLNASVGGGLDSIPTMSATVKGGAKLGNSLIVTADDKLHVALGTTPLTIEGSMWIHDPSL